MFGEGRGSHGISGCSERSAALLTTPGAADLASSGVRVTHAFHPLFTRELDVVFCRSQFGEARIYYRDGRQNLASMPASWTDAEPRDPVVAVSDGRSAFRLEDLIELAAQVVRLRS